MHPCLPKFWLDYVQLFCGSSPYHYDKHIQRRSLNLLSFRFYRGQNFGKIIDFKPEIDISTTMIFWEPLAFANRKELRVQSDTTIKVMTRRMY